MTFLYPAVIAAAVLVTAAAIAGYVALQRRRTAALTAAGFGALASGASAAGRACSARTCHHALLLAALPILLVGVARPQAEIALPRVAGTVVLAFDISNSMSADDVAPSRLAAAKAAAISFVEEQPDSVDVGVLVFGDQALLTQAPTDDHAAAVAAIRRPSASGGTSLGQAILVALGTITGKPVSLPSDGASTTTNDLGYWPSATIVIFSDGQQTSGPDAEAAAELAAAAGVRIHTVGVGTAEGDTVEVDGYQLATALDEALLTTVAQTSGGTYHAAGERGRAGRYDQVDRPAPDHREGAGRADRAVRRRRPAAPDARRAAGHPLARKDRLMSFSWPWALVALLAVPLLLVARWWLNRRRKRSAVVVSSVALIRAALPGRTSWRRRIPVYLFLAGLLALAGGLARPQASVAVPSNHTSILLAIDVSGSMCTTDIAPNRLAVASDAAREFVKAQDDGTRIGLVAFSGIAGLLVPPTTDKDALLDAIDNLKTARGTAIGQAILTSIDAIAESNPNVAATGVDLGDAAPNTGGDYQPDTIVVLTDGSNTTGVDPVTAAEQAAARGLRIYTIGFGTTEPAQMMCTADQISGGSTFGQGPRGFSGGGPRTQPRDRRGHADRRSRTSPAGVTSGRRTPTS